MKLSSGYIHSVETFGTQDGPGIRYVVFLSGCNYRCIYCHNPDTWKIQGNLIHPDQIVDDACKYVEFFGSSGGITLSGGEPLLQSNFTLSIIKLAKSKGMHVALDTSIGVPLNDTVRECLYLSDLVIKDIKHLDSVDHLAITGRPCNNNEVFDYLNKINKTTLVRQVVLQGFTDSEKYIKRLNSFCNKYHNIVKVELLPFHNMAQYKWESLDIDYLLKDYPNFDSSTLDELYTFIDKR